MLCLSSLKSLLARVARMEILFLLAALIIGGTWTPPLQVEMGSFLLEPKAFCTNCSWNPRAFHGCANLAAQFRSSRAAPHDASKISARSARKLYRRSFPQSPSGARAVALLLLLLLPCASLVSALAFPRMTACGCGHRTPPQARRRRVRANRLLTGRCHLYRRSARPPVATASNPSVPRCGCAFLTVSSIDGRAETRRR